MHPAREGHRHPDEFCQRHWKRGRSPLRWVLSGCRQLSGICYQVCFVLPHCSCLAAIQKRGCVIMAHLGRRPRASGSVIDLSQLPSPSPSGSYHLNHSDSTLSIRMQKRRWSNFDTAPLFFSAFRQMAGGSQSEVFNHASAVGCTLMKRRPSLPVENTTTPSTRA